MNKLLLSLFAAAILVLSVSTAKAADKLLVVGSASPPYEFVENDKVVGIDIDIAKAIFGKLGVEAEFKILPWTRAWGMVEKGEADAVLTTSRKDKRIPFLFYPKEDMWNSNFVFFTTTENKGATGTYADAAGKKVGIVKGSSYHDSFWAAFPYQDAEKTKIHADLRNSPDEETNFKRLAAGRVDLVIADSTVGSVLIKSMGLTGKVVPYSDTLYGKGYPMPFAKKSSTPGLKDIAAKFDAELASMKANGEYQAIVDSWIK